MPKISALTSLAQASVDTAADVLPIVDATAPATTKNVTVQAMVNAGLATLTTLPSGIVNASLNSITPTGGVLAVTGNVSATGSLQAGAGGDGALSSVRSDNTSAIASGVNLSRGNATGTNVNISTTGDGANGVAAALLRFDGTEVMRWQPGNVAVTGSISATVTDSQASIFAGADGVYSSWSNLGTLIGDVGTGDRTISEGSAADFGINARGGDLLFGTNFVQRLKLSSAGATVTGSISATNSTGRIDANDSRDGVGVGGSLFLRGKDDNGDYQDFAGINAFLTDGTVGAIDADLIFKTRLNGTLAERMRLLSSGDLLINQTTNPSSYKLAVTGNVGVTGLTTTDTLRVNVTPTAETPTATHTAVFNINGTNYKFLCLAA